MTEDKGMGSFYAERGVLDAEKEDVLKRDGLHDHNLDDEQSL